jgi:hypothetical protein
MIVTAMIQCRYDGAHNLYLSNFIEGAGQGNEVVPVRTANYGPAAPQSRWAGSITGVAVAALGL